MMSTGKSPADVEIGDKICLKEFLSSRTDESGAVVWSLDVPTTGSYYDASLQVKDCSRSVTLEFCFSDLKSLDERIEKLDKLIRCLELFKDQLEGCRRLTSITSKRREYNQ